MMSDLLTKARDAEAAVRTLRILNADYQLQHAEKIGVEKMPLHAAEVTVRQSRWKKSSPVKYIVMGRVVTPLLFANERVEESIGQDNKMVQSRTEMQKVIANCDVFPVGALNAIFAHVDRQCAKLGNPTFSALGRLAATIYEVHANELKAIHDQLGVRMTYDNVNLRVIKPYKELYNTLISTTLRFGLSDFVTVSLEDYIDAAQHYSETTIWTPELRPPAEAFYECCREVALRMGSKRQILVPEFFRRLHGELMLMWEAEVVKPACCFRRARLE